MNQKHRSSSDSMSSSELDYSDPESSERPLFHWKRIFSYKFHVFKRPIKLWIVVVLLIIILLFHRRNPIITAEELLDSELMKLQGISDIKKLPYSQRKILSTIDSPFHIGCREIDNTQPRANATFVVLARNSEVDNVIKSMISLERHFNQWFNYPWVFLNDEEFEPEFKEKVQKYSKRVEFGVIPKPMWDFDPKVDPEEIRESINNQGDRKIYYGSLELYHKMCRFFSGNFYNHPLVLSRDWYWRVEPDVEFFCDLTYDPFIEMEKHGKKYGFTIIIHELYYTVPGLFRETKAYLKKSGVNVGNAWRLFTKNFEYSKGEGAEDFQDVKDRKSILEKLERKLTMDRFLATENKHNDHIKEFNQEILGDLLVNAGELPELHEDRIDHEEYNLCHFWSNFEIARTDLFTSPEYQNYYQHLEESGGFYKERWGDAPIHSLAIAMMLNLEDIHYFRDIGYKHSTLGHCPGNAYTNNLAYIPAEENINDKNFKSYTPDYPKPNGVGCRCKCPRFHQEIEDSGSSCTKQWVRNTRDGYQPPKPLNLDFYRKKLDKKLTNYLKNGGILGDNRLANQLIS